MSQQRIHPATQRNATNNSGEVLSIVLAVLLGPIGLVVGVFFYIRSYKSGKSTSLALTAIGIGMIWTVIAMCGIVAPAQTHITKEQEALSAAMEQLERSGYTLDDLREGSIGNIAFPGSSEEGTKIIGGLSGRTLTQASNMSVSLTESANAKISAQLQSIY